MAVIPACPAALPKLARLALSPLNNDSPFDTWLTFSSFDPGIQHELLGLGDGMNTGALSSLEAHTRLNRIFVAPTFQGTPVATEWQDVLPWIMDGTRTGTGTNADPYVHPLGNTLSKRYALLDDTQRTWTIHEIGVDTATISSDANDPAVKLSLDMVGVNYTTPGAAFPGGLSLPAVAPFVHTDACAAVTINGVETKTSRIQVSISKNVARDRFFNCPTIACAVSQDRTVRVAFEIPYGLHNTIWNLGGATSVPVVITYTYGVYKLILSMPRVRRSPQAVPMIVPNESMVSWEGEAKATIALNDELVISLAVAA